MRGRKPTLKIPPDEHEPTLPTCPEGLPPAAAAEFERIAQMLYEANHAQEPDRYAIALFAAAWCTWCKAQEEIAKTAEVIKSGGAGGAVQNPWLAVATGSVKTMSVLIPELGLSPTARQRLKPKKKQTNTAPSKWAGLLAAQAQ